MLATIYDFFSRSIRHPVNGGSTTDHVQTVIEGQAVVDGVGERSEALAELQRELDAVYDVRVRSLRAFNAVMPLFAHDMEKARLKHERLKAQLPKRAVTLVARTYMHLNYGRFGLNVDRAPFAHELDHAREQIGHRFDHGFADRALLHLPEIADHVSGTWVGDIIMRGVAFRLIGEDVEALIHDLAPRYPYLGTEMGFARMDEQCRIGRYIASAKALQRIVGKRNDDLPHDLALINRDDDLPCKLAQLVEALDSVGAKRLHLPDYMRLLLDEAIERRRAGDPGLDYARAMVEGLPHGDVIWRFRTEQARRLGLVAVDDGWRTTLTMSGYRYLSDRAANTDDRLRLWKTQLR